MNKKITIGLAVAIVIIAIGGYFNPQVQTVVREIKESAPLGAVATLDGVDHPNISISGRRSAQKTVTITATSSALCSLGPRDVGLGTSTANFSFKITTSTIGKSEFVGLSTSTTRYGSSTNNWMKITIPALGAQFGAALHWNSATTTAQNAAGTGAADLWPGTNASGTSAYIILPGENLNLRIGTSTPGTFATFPQGTCSYEFIEL